MISLQAPVHKLSPPFSEAPVILPVFRTGDNQIMHSNTTLLLQPRRELLVELQLHLRRPPLLEDLYKNKLLCAFVAETGILADHFVRLMLRDDLVAIVGWGVEVDFEDGLDDVGEVFDFLGSAPFDEVEFDERHVW